jgi:hypothetical protein
VSDSRESILARIRALTSKTVEAGCTEGEAVAAAAKVAELMDRYGFATADLEEKEEITAETFFAPGKRLGSLRSLCVDIASFCDVKVWATRPSRSEAAGVRYFGRESDVQVALYLTHLLDTAMRGAWSDHYNRFLRSADDRLNGRTLRAAFEAGMRSRLRSRLAEIKAERNRSVDAATGRTGRDLVVVKGNEVAVAFRALGMHLTGGGVRRGSIADRDSYDAGKAAGDRVTITTGVGRGYAVGLLA